MTYAQKCKNMHVDPSYMNGRPTFLNHWMDVVITHKSY